MWEGQRVTEAFTTALIAELAKKTAVCWLAYDEHEVAPGPGRSRPAWHVWYDDALHLVAGGDEQHLPGIDETDRVEVTMRSKESGGRLVTWVGSVRVVPPGHEAWDDITSALVSSRLNLEDLTTVKEHWATHSVVVRVDPTGELLEQPGALSEEPHDATPRPTGATTRGVPPRVLHRRQQDRPRLS
jgi:hypothetical protein